MWQADLGASRLEWGVEKIKGGGKLELSIEQRYGHKVPHFECTLQRAGMVSKLSPNLNPFRFFLFPTSHLHGYYPTSRCDNS